MPNMLADGLTHLAAQLVGHASESVRYCRDDRSKTVKAVLGRKLLRLDDGDGYARTTWTDMDFLIRSSELVLDGERIEPTAGDQVEITRSTGAIEVYQVASPGAGEPPWRWADPHRVLLRIHTFHVEDRDLDAVSDS